jgi:hypothetical protein
MDFIPLFQQKLRQKRPILPCDSCYEGLFHS